MAYKQDLEAIAKLLRGRMEREAEAAAAASTASAMAERRAAVTEIRVPGGRRLAGYAAKFGTEARIGNFTESIAPGAFAAALQSGRDILALKDHDPNDLLGRTSSGTLKLSEDSVGLQFEILVPDTTVGTDVLQLASRGDLGGMSFGFVIPEGGDVWNGERRTLTKIDLREISVVSAWPAYPQTTIQARSAPKAKPSLALALRYLETLQ